MVAVNNNTERKIRSSQSSITSLSIFVALSAAMIALLLTQTSIEVGYNAAFVSSVSFAVAIALFFIALEFFILCIYHCELIDFFGVKGSCLYALGVTFIILGISTSLIVFGLRELSCIFLTVVLIGYSVYYGMRWRKLGRETDFTMRKSSRIAIFSIIGVGYCFIFTLGG